CDGAITRALRASRSSTGALRSIPMPGWRNNSGRPAPRSTSSTLTPSTTTDEMSAATFIQASSAKRRTMLPGVIICATNAFPFPPGPAIMDEARGCGQGVIGTMTSLSQANEKDEVDVRSGLTYATHDGVALLGDLYRPKGAGPFPVLVALHGGGWVQGVRSAFQYWGPYLAARGYALFAISYRLAKTGQKTFPHAVQDALAAVQFVRGSAEEFRLDPERIGILGASAGANIGSLAALGGDAAIFKGGYKQDAHAAVSAKVKVLVGVYGVYDMLEMWQRYNLASPG